MIDRLNAEVLIERYTAARFRASNSRRLRFELVGAQIDAAVATATWCPDAPDGERVQFNREALARVLRQFRDDPGAVQVVLWERLARALLAHDHLPTPQSARARVVTVELDIRLERSRGVQYAADRFGNLHRLE